MNMWKCVRVRTDWEGWGMENNEKDFLVVFSIFYENSKESRRFRMRSRHECHAVIQWIASSFSNLLKIAIISFPHKFLRISRMKIGQRKFSALSSMRENFFLGRMWWRIFTSMDDVCANLLWYTKDTSDDSKGRKENDL